LRVQRQREHACQSAPWHTPSRYNQGLGINLMQSCSISTPPKSTTIEPSAQCFDILCGQHKEGCQTASSRCHWLP
jgi:hypothetical protein